MDKNRIKAYVFLLITAILWGWSAPIVKYTLRFIDPIGFLFYRFLLVSGLFFFPFLIALKKKPLALPDFGRHLLIGLLGGPITLLMIFFGADQTTSLNASLIVAMAPVFIVLAGAYVLKERVTKRERVGLLIALGGTVVTVVQPLLTGDVFARQHLQGNLIIFGHNFVWMVYCILVKKETRQHSPLILTAITFFSGLLVLPFLYGFQHSGATPFFQLHPQAIPGILYMSVFASAIAYTTYNWGVSLIEASEATLFTYLQPVFAAPLSFFWLKEPLTLPLIGGAAFIALGVFISETRSQKS